LISEEIRGDLRVDESGNPISVIPVATPVGTSVVEGTTATINISLTHPATGDPEANVAIKVEVKEGDGVLDCSPHPSCNEVYTDAQGTAQVILTDLNGGINEVILQINEAITPVSYENVEGYVRVAFE